MSLPYQFSTDHAIKYGVNEAIFLHNLQFWIMKNRSNKKNLFEDRTWTYNSYNAYVDLFPFWTKRQIRYVVQNLVEIGVIITRQEQGYNQNDGLYYAFKNESDFLPEIKKHIDESDGGVTKLSWGVTKLSHHTINTYSKPYKKRDFKNGNKKGGDMAINYHCEQIEHCKFNHQDKKFGEEGYFCINPGIENVKTQTDDSQIYNLLMCPRHEKIVNERKTFKFDKLLLTVVKKESS